MDNFVTGALTVLAIELFVVLIFSIGGMIKND